MRVRGGNTKIKLKKVTHANIGTPNGIKRSKIVKVVKSNTAAYTKQNIIVKGTLVQTEIGLAKVTSRPGQDGVVNAKLVESKKEE